MITPDEARKENTLMADNHIQLTKEKYYFDPRIWERRKQHYLLIDNYITQQEKKDKLLELYRQFIKDMGIKVRKNFLDCDWLTYNHAQFPNHTLTHETHLIKTFEQIQAIEEELK